ncbi:hypothetical protein [Rahnella contaminans]|uniref:hypothetical protein n=1 Tax=Rahnella contaminans TaxID=2703882 RepID=UPI003C2CE9B3
MHNNQPFFKAAKFLLNTFKKILAFLVYYALEFLYPLLVIVGSLLCMMKLEPWPVKFIGMALWLAFLYGLYNIIDRFFGKN